jgi:hypothetical protein
MDPSEAIKIGPVVIFSRTKIGLHTAVEPPEQISAAAPRTDAIRQISKKK